MVSEQVIRIMEDIFNNPEKLIEEELNNKFGEKNYQDFSQFCLGGTKPLAQSLGRGKMFKLTQDGVRELHILTQQKNQKNFNKISIIVTFILGLGTLGNLLMNVINTRWDITSFNIGVIIMLISGLMVGLLYNVFFEIRKIWKN